MNKEVNLINKVNMNIEVGLNYVVIKKPRGRPRKVIKTIYVEKKCKKHSR